ncbi:ABC transporter permease subunit [Candidatus Enterococcus willemsii]|uniref:Amino acid ABC transporter permease n=1 Tax=Candidatus Enterococcus willemsii TaxID=1857215 RepID=A0ABQ6Z281_9ENTE|nr:ABC transporter permease subunit [Enterococcus sp. CU12B]KAF1305719.1 amino acid ABC transporter permease [Enterococcus sp. CU12B]
MKKKSFTLLFVMIISLFVSVPSLADEKNANSDTFRVGMEAAYAPFNWTQTTDANGAVPKSGEKNTYVGGYDVEMAKRIADGLGKELEVVAIQWDGLVPALQSGKIDAIIAGMSPTEERRKEIDFTDSYYESHLVIVTQKDGPYANAKTLADFEGAKITAQLNTFHYSVIDQIPGVEKQQAQQNFSAMRVALSSGVIDGYVSERPEGVTASNVNKNLTMVEFSEADGFQTNPEDVQVAVGLRKNDPAFNKINEILAGIPQEERNKIMDTAVENQPSASDEENVGLVQTFKQIIQQYGNLFLRGAGITLFIAIFSTIAGTLIGLLVGVFRTLPMSENPVARFFQKVVNGLLTLYIEVFRGTPMMVQAMVIFYGLALAFQIDLNRTVAALIIVSINTGAYMSEIVRGGIFAVDKGQFEAAQAIGMTHSQTMIKVVLPQVVRNILPAIGNETVINIKDTAVLSVISVGDLFFQGSAAAGTNLLFFQTFTIIGAIYLVLTITATRLLRLMEKKIDGPTAYVQIDETSEGQE